MMSYLCTGNKSFTCAQVMNHLPVHR